MNPARRPLRLVAISTLFLAGAAAQHDGPLGYDDTPHLPGGEWRVHDGTRPQPTIVSPGATASAAPSDAIVLFDGTDLSGWRAGDEIAKWSIEDGAMVVNGSGSIVSAESFGDMQLHIEWATPSKVEGSSQGRGNSGVFLMNRYEVQILDSYDNKTYPDGQAAALYGQMPPAVNACRAPGEWQSYDIVFRAPRYEGGQVAQPARATVLHNGVVVHDAQEFLGRTTHRNVAKYEDEHPAEAPIALQDHGNPVRFRNIWVRRL